MFTSFFTVLLLAAFVNGTPNSRGPDDEIGARSLTEEDAARSNDDVLDCHFTCVGGGWTSWLWRDGCRTGCDIYPSTTSAPTTEHDWNMWWWKERENHELQEADADPNQNQTESVNSSGIFEKL